MSFVIEHWPDNLQNPQHPAARAAVQPSSSWSLGDGARLVSNLVLDAIAPPRCAGCGWFSEHLFCGRCAPRVRRTDQGAEVCECCGERFDPLAVIAPGTVCAACRKVDEAKRPIARARSLWMLRGPVRLAVHDFKYRRHTRLAPWLGAHMALVAQSDPILSRAHAVVPVPLFAWREWTRGFNQSAMLAREVSRVLGVPCLDALRRVRHTPSQTTLTREARGANVSGAFAVRARSASKYLEATGGPILLIDDVWTTGATLYECARTLRKAGCREVYALTLARRGSVAARAD